MRSNQDAFSIVVLGAMNPPVHHPAWYGDAGILTRAEADQALRLPGFECSGEIADFTLPDLRMICTRSRWSVTTTRSDALDRMLNMAVLTCGALRDAPVSTLGLHFDYQRDAGVGDVREKLARIAQAIPLGLPSRTVLGAALTYSWEIEHGEASLLIAPVESPGHVHVKSDFHQELSREREAPLGESIRRRFVRAREDAEAQLERTLVALAGLGAREAGTKAPRQPAARVHGESRLHRGQLSSRHVADWRAAYSWDNFLFACSWCAAQSVSTGSTARDIEHYRPASAAWPSRESWLVLAAANVRQEGISPMDERHARELDGGLDHRRDREQQDLLFPANTYALQPIDLLVAMKIAAAGDAELSLGDLEEQLGVPGNTAELSLQRLTALKIVRSEENRLRVNRIAFRDLMEHGVRWIAPGEVGDFDRGLPTSHTAEPLASHLRSDPDPLVMPLAHGPARGRAVTPIHPMAPKAAANDEKLYRLLVIADAFRIGRARDREVARMELRRAV